MNDSFFYNIVQNIHHDIIASFPFGLVTHVLIAFLIQCLLIYCLSSKYPENFYIKILPAILMPTLLFLFVLTALNMGIVGEGVGIVYVMLIPGYLLNSIIGIVFVFIRRKTI